VLALVAGGNRERYPVGRQRWSKYALTAHDGSGSESGRANLAPFPPADSWVRKPGSATGCRLASLAVGRHLGLVFDGGTRGRAAVLSPLGSRVIGQSVCMGEACFPVSAAEIRGS
jgi:hypothetical protein